MSQRKPAAAEKRLVWRIDARNPSGAFVDPTEEIRLTPRREPVDPAFATSGWMVSSHELREGTEITEGEDTVPADLFDELFPQSAPTLQAPSDAS